MTKLFYTVTIAHRMTYGIYLVIKIIILVICILLILLLITTVKRIIGIVIVKTVIVTIIVVIVVTSPSSSSSSSSSATPYSYPHKLVKLPKLELLPIDIMLEVALAIIFFFPLLTSLGEYKE